MKKLTWKAIAGIINALPPERLEDNATVLDSQRGEYFAVTATAVAEQDVLDEGALVLAFNELLESDEDAEEITRRDEKRGLYGSAADVAN